MLSWSIIILIFQISIRRERPEGSAFIFFFPLLKKKKIIRKSELLTPVWSPDTMEDGSSFATDITEIGSPR